MLLLVIYMKAVVDQLPRLEKRELIFVLQLFTCNYVVSVRRGFLFLWVLAMGCIILLRHYLSLLYYHLTEEMLYVPYAYSKHLESVLRYDDQKK